MSTAETIGLLVALAGVNLVGVIGAAWKISGAMASRFTRIETKLEPLEGMTDRVTRVETTVEQHDEVLSSAFQMTPMMGTKRA